MLKKNLFTLCLIATMLSGCGSIDVNWDGTKYTINTPDLMGKVFGDSKQKNETQDELNNKLFRAIRNNNIDMAKEAIEHGASLNSRINVQSKGICTNCEVPVHTAITWAATNNRKEMIQLLIEKGVNINAPTWDRGITALIVAIIEGSSAETIQFMIDKGADVNAKTKSNNTALMYAAQYSRPKTIRVLIKNGADVGIKTKKGESALDMIGRERPYILWGTRDDMYRDQKEVLLALTEGGAVASGISSNHQSRYNSMSRYDMIYEAANAENDVSLQNLLDSGIHIDSRNSRGETALFNVSGQGGKLLIEKGADINAKDSKGNVAWRALLCNDNNLDIVRMLIKDNKIDIHTKDDSGRTPLHQVALCGNTNIAKLLIDNGADVNARDNNNETVLARAVLKMENPEAVRLLIQKGADVNADLGDGYTALDHVEAVMATKLTAIWSTRGVKVENAPQIKQILLNAKAKSSGQGVKSVEGSNAIATGFAKAVQFVGEAIAEGAKNTTHVGVDKPWGVSAAHICITGSDGVEYGKHGNKCSSGGTGISKKAGNYRYVVYFEDHYDHSILGYKTRVKGACSGTFSTNGTEQSIYLYFNSKLDCNDVNIYKN